MFENGIDVGGLLPSMGGRQPAGGRDVDVATASEPVLAMGLAVTKPGLHVAADAGHRSAWRC